MDFCSFFGPKTEIKRGVRVRTLFGPNDKQMSWLRAEMPDSTARCRRPGRGSAGERLHACASKTRGGSLGSGRHSALQACGLRSPLASQLQKDLAHEGPPSCPASSASPPRRCGSSACAQRPDARAELGGLVDSYNPAPRRVLLGLRRALLHVQGREAGAGAEWRRFNVADVQPGLFWCGRRGASSGKAPRWPSAVLRSTAGSG